jgi:hypothetical protein
LARRTAEPEGQPAGEPLGWTRSPRPEGTEKPEATKGRKETKEKKTGGGLWLIFADGLGLGNRVAALLAQEETDATTVTPGAPGAALTRTGERSWSLPPAGRAG